MHVYNQPSQPPTRKRRRRRSLLLSFLGFGFGALVVGFTRWSFGHRLDAGFGFVRLGTLGVIPISAGHRGSSGDGRTGFAFTAARSPAASAPAPALACTVSLITGFGAPFAMPPAGSRAPMTLATRRRRRTGACFAACGRS